MEKKQQTTGKLPADAPAAVKRNTNTDENVERAYDEQTAAVDNTEEIDGDDAAHDALKEEAAKNGMDF
ncbi:hypothetical protein I5907_20425 [Panacibacter sp. DH6]|uniref:YfhD family protein n=1 Tax=Panacibacter microcysteis TaxID=2793269 RepID=A0A931H086_9BACT|nr:hypothetical protein [Panacibacter microcysteis]MBG9378610.1 hypothetical protein [Panacibacter microcysteis]